MIGECENCGMEFEDCRCDDTEEGITSDYPTRNNSVQRDYRQEEWLMRYHYAQTQHQNDQNR